MDSPIAQVLALIKELLDSLQAAVAPWLPSQQVPAYLAFALYVLMMLGGGLTAVGARNLVRAMMGLILTFLGVSGLYLLMASPFMAFMQLLIYVGAVCVLIFFAIMLTANVPGGQEAKLPGPGGALRGLAVFVAPLAVLGPLLVKHVPDLELALPEATPTSELGRGLIGEDVVPFELISIILLAAMAGAVFLAWRRRPEGRA
ncbi:MAG: NADH-quinone oxidoreductase subunit J [Deltaproteobacteria bacterium]|jgi:NADH-quinone oxidoreductase subunit J|nr:NADH-quinone oxidoreductase subunit J [Deltaproteobacteria bacterium]